MAKKREKTTARRRDSKSDVSGTYTGTDLRDLGGVKRTYTAAEIQDLKLADGVTVRELVQSESDRPNYHVREINDILKSEIARCVGDVMRYVKNLESCLAEEVIDIERSEGRVPSDRNVMYSCTASIACVIRGLVEHINESVRDAISSVDRQLAADGMDEWELVNSDGNVCKPDGTPIWK